MSKNKIIPQKEAEPMLNSWFRQQEFRICERISGFKLFGISEDNIEEVLDEMHKWWDELEYSEKVSYFKKWDGNVVSLVKNFS